MADNQKYYYMRLKEGFFEEDAIKIIESMPDGYLYSNILLKLYLKSLKYNGKLMFNERIPYNPDVLAAITHHQVGTIEKALKLFKEMDLIEILDNGLRPSDDDTLNFGTAGRRWKAIYAMTDVISTSDENQKQDIADIPDEVLTAWGKVNFKQFHFKADVLADGEDAKLYCGVIAQQILSAFTEAGLDACKYGLVCPDTDDEGNTVYGVRYREALVMEAAYQRKKLADLEARILALETA